MFGVPYHFLVVHFPLVLALLALLYDGRGLHDIGYRFTLGAAFGSLLAIPTGLMLAGGQLSRMTVHAAAALVGALALVALAMLRYSRKAREEEALASFPSTWMALEVLGTAGMVISAMTGHRAVLGL
jgi:predicted aspartyl protease